MKAVVALLALAVSAGVRAVPAKTYTSIYDNVDLDSVLRNERLYSKYFACVMNKGKCPPDGVELKKNLPEALQTRCSMCTEKQRAGAEKVIRYILTHRPADYKAMEALYDPERKNRAYFEEEAAKQGLKLPD